MLTQNNPLTDLKSSISPNLEIVDGLLPNFFSNNAEIQDINKTLKSTIYIKNRNEIINKSNSFLLTIFKELNKQILDGSYTNVGFSICLTEIEKDIAQLRELFVVYFDSFIKDKTLQSFKLELDKAKSAIIYLKNICTNLFYSENKITYSIATSLSETFDIGILEEIVLLNSIEIVSFNIYLIKADHYLSINNDQLIKNLEYIYSKSKKLKLEDFDDKDYVKICKLIFSKSNFLKKKVLLRRTEEVLSEKGKLFIQSKNEFKEYSDKDIINSPNINEFKPWLKYIINHYDLVEGSEISIEDTATNNELTFPIKKSSLENIHLNIKYNKDILSTESFDLAYRNLKNIKKYLVKSLTQSKENTFEEYCLITNTTYCYNNILSLLEKNNKGVELIKVYTEFRSNQRLKNRKNYFATGSVLNFYAKELEKIFNKDDFNSEISECTNILDKCEKLIKVYNEEVEWFKNHNNYIYLLPFEESKIEIDGFKLYIFSSIVLPTSEKYLINKFEKPVNDIKFYRTSFKSIDTIKSSLETVKELSNNISTLEQKLADKDTRTLELVALIGALFSFIAGSIPGFQFINTGIEALWFTIALGTSLSFFIFLLFILNKGIDYLKKGWWIVILYFLFITLIWCFLYSSSSTYANQKFDKTEIKKYMDSINVINQYSNEKKQIKDSIPS